MMQENKAKPSRGALRGCRIVGAIVFGAFLLTGALWFTRVLSRRSEKAPQTYSIHHARQITLALKLYASDHNGMYPDSGLETVLDSNTVFDELIREGIVTSEAIFGSRNSIFNPDGDLETPLTEGRNQVHWSIVLGRSDHSRGDSAIVFENAIALRGVGEPTWGPPDVKGKTRGRSWSDPRIIIATNDGAVQTHALDPATYRLDFENPFQLMNSITYEREELSWVGGR